LCAGKYKRRGKYYKNCEEGNPDAVHILAPKVKGNRVK
jgi:hypothetical protein